MTSVPSGSASAVMRRAGDFHRSGDCAVPPLGRRLLRRLQYGNSAGGQQPVRRPEVSDGRQGCDSRCERPLGQQLPCRTQRHPGGGLQGDRHPGAQRPGKGHPHEPGDCQGRHCDECHSGQLRAGLQRTVPHPGRRWSGSRRALQSCLARAP